MGILGWRRGLPARLRPRFEREERMLAWAGLPDDGVLVATNRGLWVPAEPASGGTVRIGWHEIHKATWSERPDRTLAVTPARTVPPAGDREPPEGYTVMADAETVTYRLVDPGRVPEHVRTRVTRSVAYTAHHPLPGGGGVRVVARRVSGVDGLRWTVRYDAGTDPAAAGVAEATADLVARARAGAA